jgi:hypothetical protein
MTGATATPTASRAARDSGERLSSDFEQLDKAPGRTSASKIENLPNRHLMSLQY